MSEFGAVSEVPRHVRAEVRERPEARRCGAAHRQDRCVRRHLAHLQRRRSPCRTWAMGVPKEMERRHACRRPGVDGWLRKPACDIEGVQVMGRIEGEI